MMQSSSSISRSRTWLRNLEAAGMGIADLVKMTVYLTESMDMDSRRAIYAARPSGHAP
jgi:enamine deaminase RidA (YjgF/YER057c/UK114 family)